jgi:UPF0755 protein
LPPTPICNPGREAIQAALNPARTKDLYFVADGTGGHIFSETLQEHNAAVANWRKIEQEAREKAAKEAAAAGSVEAGNQAQEADGGAAADASDTAVAAQTEAAAAAVADADRAENRVARAAGSVPLPVRKPR